MSKVKAGAEIPWDRIAQLRDRVRGENIILKDIDGDPEPEILYMIKDGYWKVRRGGVDYFYTLCYRDVLDDGFGPEKEIRRFRGKPEGMVIDDVDGDEKADILYLQKGEYLFMKFEKHLFIYKLMFMKGVGDGTFDEPEEIDAFFGLPENM